MSVRTAILIGLSLIAGFAAFWLVPQPLPELSRAEFLDEVRAGHVQTVDIEDQEVIIGESSTRGRFRTGFSKQRDAGLSDELRGAGVEVRFTRSPLGI